MLIFMNKVINKIRCELKKLIYKLMYKNNIQLGNKILFTKGFKLVIHDGNLQIGNYVFFNCYCSINCIEKITIGDYCQFGEGVKIYDHNHKFRERGKLIREQGCSKKPITIGKNCWIGSNVTILQGVTIGNNVTIGANCLIYKDIPDDTLVMCDQKLTTIDL